MASTEEVAYPILRKHDVEYVLVIFGGLIGYSGDDINKFLWMVRIAQGVWPDEIQESNYFTPRGEYRIDDNASPTMKNSLMYKMTYYRFVPPFSCVAASNGPPASANSSEEDLPRTVSVNSKCPRLDPPLTTSVCFTNLSRDGLIFIGLF